jgi:peroxiredoxin
VVAAAHAGILPGIFTPTLRAHGASMSLRTTVSLALILGTLPAQKVGTDAPELAWTATFEFGDIASAKLSELRGSVVLLAFFSVRSVSARDEVVRLNKLHADKVEKGLVVISVTSEEASSVANYVKKHSVKHPAAVGFNENYDVQGVPDAFLIDKDGKVAWHGHPASIEMATLDKLLVGAKPAIVMAGLEDLQMLRKLKDHGGIYKKAKQLLEAGGLSEGAQAQAKDWMQTSEQFVAKATADADKAEAAKDLYQLWLALEPVATSYQGVPGAAEAKTRFDALMADPKNKREIEAAKKVAEAKTREAASDFDGAFAIYKETEKLYGNTKAGKAAAVAWKAIEKDGKLGYQATCGYCKAGGRACPQHAKKKK